MKAHDRSAAVKALMSWLHSQQIGVTQAGVLLSDTAAVLVADAAEQTGKLETLVDGVEAMHRDIMLTALRLYLKETDKVKK